MNRVLPRHAFVALLVLSFVSPSSSRAQDAGVPEPPPPPPPQVEPAPEAPEAAPDESDEGFSDEELLDEIEAEVEQEVLGGAPEGEPDASDEADATAGESTDAEERARAPERLDLEDERTLTLPEAVVHYTLEDVLRTGGAVSLIGEEQLEAHEYDDPHSVLLRVPGVYVRGEDGFGLRPNIGLRGTRSDRSSSVTLMEDGVLLGPAPYSAPAAYYFPLITRMVGVEIFKGPAAILFGPQTVGGALNFLAREIPSEGEGQIDFSYGMFRARKLHFHYGTSNRWGGLLFEGVDLFHGGFKDIDFADDETGFHRGEYVLRGFVQSDPHGRIYNRLELKLGYSHELSHETYLGLTDADFRDDPYRRYAASQRDRMRWDRFQVELFHRLSVGENFDLFTTLYRHDFHRVWRRLDRFDNGSGPSLFQILTQPNAPITAPYLEVLRGERDSENPEDALILAINDRRYVSQGIQSNARYRLRTGRVNHQIDAGVRFHYDEIDRDHGSDRYLMRSGTLVLDTSLAPTADETASTFAFAGFAAYGLDFAGLRLSPGLRVEAIHQRLDDRIAGGPDELDNYVVVLPGIGVQYSITDWLGVLAGVHRGFSPVAPGQLSASPEYSLNYELGARVHHEDLGIDAELVGFFNDYSNLLLTCTGASGCAGDIGDQSNAGSARIGGFEALYAQTFEIDDDIAIPVRATYTFTIARLHEANGAITSPPDYAGAQSGDFMPYIPRHQATAELGLTWDRVGVRLTGAYIGEMLEQAGDPDEVLRTDDAFFLDVFGSFRLTERGEVYARFENVTNAQPIVSRRPFGARPARPFQAQVGIKIDL